MLHSAKVLRGYVLRSLDSVVGHVEDFYFDDHFWTVRYLVADTSTWLADRQVLISPHSLTAVDPEKGSIAVDLTKQQIENNPTLDSDKPVSRQFEQEYYGYYGGPEYWNGEFTWVPTPTSPAIQRGFARRILAESPGTATCEAHPRWQATTFTPRTVKLDMSRISSSTTRPGLSAT